MGGLRDPSDIRFFDGLRDCVWFEVLSSTATIEGHTDDIPVLVADSEVRSRRQVPSTSILHLPLLELEPPELRSNSSVLDED